MAEIDLKNYDFNRGGSTASAVNADKEGIDWGGLLSKDIQLFGNKLKDATKERFYNELNILLTAGIDIKTAFEIIAEEQKKKKDRELFEEIGRQIVAGNSLSEALQQSQKFSNYEYYSLQIGEESGRLKEVLKELSRFFNNRIKQRRQFISALSYPLLVIFTAVGAVFFMMAYIVPMFASVFDRFGKELPFLTKMVVNFSDLVGAYYSYFFLFCIGLVVFYFTQRKKNWFRKVASKVVLKIPLIGKLIQKIYIAQLCQSMALLIGAKIPILRSIHLVNKMIAYYPIEESLTAAQDSIMDGNSLFKSLAVFPFYTRRFISLVKVGEETNNLDLIFDRLANQYTEEVEYQTNVLGSLIEPILIIFLGLMVGLILIAMYLPLFQLSLNI